MCIVSEFRGVGLSVLEKESGGRSKHLIYRELDSIVQLFLAARQYLNECIQFCSFSVSIVSYLYRFSFMENYFLLIQLCLSD